MKLKKAYKYCKTKYKKGWIAVDADLQIYYYSIKPNLFFIEGPEAIGYKSKSKSLTKYIGQYTGSKPWITTLKRIK